MKTLGIPITRRELGELVPVNIAVNYEFAFCEQLLDPLLLALEHSVIHNKIVTYPQGYSHANIYPSHLRFVGRKH